MFRTPLLILILENADPFGNASHFGIDHLPGLNKPSMVVMPASAAVALRKSRRAMSLFIGGGDDTFGDTAGEMFLLAVR